MPRIRAIKHDYFTNEDLAQISLAARLLGLGLTTLADREGRLEDRPLRIRAQIFPYDQQLNCDDLLNELQGAQFIHRYSTEDSHYIQIVNFHRHQTPHFKERPSSIPPPVDLPVDILRKPCESPPCIMGNGSTGNGKLDMGNGKSQPKPRRDTKPDDPNAQDRAELLTLLVEANGPLPTTVPQTKAINWLFEVGYSRDECARCFAYLVAQTWRTTAVTWQTVKKEIGAWKHRGEPLTENRPGNGNGHAKSSNVDYSMASVNSAYERALAEEANEERSN